MTMKLFSRDDINAMDRRYRAHFINSLSGFKSANLVGTTSEKCGENLAIISSVFHLGANPPLLGLIMRPSNVPRHSLENILESKVFTLNHVAKDFYQNAHQTSAKYGKEQSEFEHAGLTPEYLNVSRAPFVKESRLKVALNLVDHQTLINNTVLIVGEITTVLSDVTALNDDGYIDISQLGTVAVSGLDCYLKTEKLARLKYAKPEQAVSKL